ncbi:MAG: hypothetical protein ACI92W_001885 [Paraglaciecola sp.]|jgi:hypothetical protein
MGSFFFFSKIPNIAGSGDNFSFKNTRSSFNVKINIDSLKNNGDVIGLYLGSDVVLMLYLLY